MQAVQRVSAQVATGAPHLGSAPVKCAFKCGVQRAGRVIRAQATAVEGQQAVDQAPVKVPMFLLVYTSVVGTVSRVLFTNAARAHAS